MYVKKYLMRYSLVCMGLPLIMYVAAMFGSDMVKKIVSVSLVILAVLIVCLSSRIIDYMFATREQDIVDSEFVIKMSCAIGIIYFFRYIVANVVTLAPKYNSEIMIVLSAPVWLLIFIPLLKNYCLNKETVAAALALSALVVYAIIPIGIFGVSKFFSSDYLILDGVQYNYFGYNGLIDKALYYASSLVGIRLSGMTLMAAEIVGSLLMWCVMYLPYVIISAVWVDEMSYMEKGRFVTNSTFYVVLIIMVVIAAGCVYLGIKGKIEPGYFLRHNI